MIELVIWACSLLQGASCKEVSLVYADVPMLTCVMAGMPEVAKWADQHPNWSVAKWSCRPAGQFARI